MNIKLWQQVLIGLLLGVVTGLIFGEQASALKILGTIFINLIKMVIVPLIFFAILSGITSVTEQSNMTRVGIKGFGGYLITGALATALGLAIGHIFAPGEGMNLNVVLQATQESVKPESFKIGEFLINLIPVNPIHSMATDNFLQIIIFALFTGISINLVGEKAKPVKLIIHSFASVAFKMIEIIIKLAPIGIFGFIAWMVGTQGLETLTSLGKLIIAVITACTLQYIIFGILIIVFTGLSPMPFYKKIFPVQSIAFSTSSSKATLSTAMTQLQDKLGVSKANSNFLMPLGVCINMDGTAIYLGICALFFSQAYGIDLTFQNYIMLILTCTIGSIGAAGIPSGAIIFMGMVLTSVGLPLEGIGLIIGIDRILDMIRTTINITGDSAITLIIDKTEGTLDKKTYYAKN